MGSDDYVMDKDTDAKLFAAALYVISDMWGKEMGDMQRASLANQIVREIERRAILAAPPSPRSDEGEGKPVAWMWRHPYFCKGDWQYQAERPPADVAAQAIPLFSAPPSPTPSGDMMSRDQEVERLREALRDLLPYAVPNPIDEGGMTIREKAARLLGGKCVNCGGLPDDQYLKLLLPGIPRCPWRLHMSKDEGTAEIVAAVLAEREAILETTRRYAKCYPDDSDGRNTFTLLAEWIASRPPSTAAPISAERDEIIEMCAKVADGTAKSLRVYRDHFFIADHVDAVAADIRSLKSREVKP